MEIQLGAYPQLLLLVFARIVAVLWTVPFFGGSKAPAKIRVSLALMMTVVMMSIIPEEWAGVAEQIRTLPQMLMAVLSEILLGAGVGLICHAFIAATMLGGMLVGRGSSLMMARSIDPIGGAQNNLIAQMLQMVFILFVLLNNGHLVLIKFLAMSFQSASHPMAWAGGGFSVVLSLGSTMFEWAVKLALPVLCASLILNVCLGLVARLAPDFNILFLSLPVRLFVGLSTCGFILRFGAGLFERLTVEMLERCGRVLAG